MTVAASTARGRALGLLYPPGVDVARLDAAAFAADATAAAAAVEHADAGHWGSRETLLPLVTEYCSEKRRLHEHSGETSRRQEYTLLQFSGVFGGRPLRHLTRPAVERWLMSIEDLSPGTRRTKLSQVKTFCGWLVRHDHIKKDPTYGLRVKKECYRGR